jgi:hypothetical protein
MTTLRRSLQGCGTNCGNRLPIYIYIYIYVCVCVCYPHLLQRSASTEVGFRRKEAITFVISVRLLACIRANPRISGKVDIGEFDVILSRNSRFG